MHAFLPEIVVPGKRLGRHIRHDPRSLQYLVSESAAASVSWDRRVPIFDQGDVGSCTGNACAGALGSEPFFDTLPDLIEDEALAVSIYSDAETLDGDGPYPPNDNGSSGLSVAKVAKTRGYISGYLHATSVAAAHTALGAGPVLVGSYWYSGMDDPTSEGIVQPTGAIRGGHEYLCRQYDAARDLWWFDNSWSDSWGKAGRFAYDSAAFAKLLAARGDVTSLVPVTVPTPTPTPAPTPSAYSVQFDSADSIAVLDKWSLGRFAARTPSAKWRAARGLG